MPSRRLPGRLRRSMRPRARSTRRSRTLSLCSSGRRGSDFRRSGWGYLYAWRTRLFGDLILRLGGVVDRWRDRLGQFDAAATAYDSSSATLSDVQRFEALARMDLMVAGLPVSPRPATPDDYDNLLRAPSNPQARRRLFEEKLEALEAVLANGTSNLGALIAAIQAELPLDAFDLAGLPVDDVVSGVAAFRNELQLRIVNLKAYVDQRLAAAGQALEAHDQSASPRHEGRGPAVGSDQRRVRSVGEARSRIHPCSRSCGRDRQCLRAGR